MIQVVRRHWFLFLFDVILLFGVAILPPVLVSFIPPTFEASLPVGVAWGDIGFFLYCLWLLFLWVALFVRWTDYYLDMWVITDKRIMDIEQKGLFNRDITTASLSRIQDVTIDVRGIFATLLGFGDVRVETAGASENTIVIKTANNPAQVKEIILRAGDSAPHPSL